MEQDIPFLVHYSLHFILVAFLIFLLFERKYRKFIMMLWSVFSIFFVYRQVEAIIESETTWNIISHTKLSICYLILFGVTQILIWTSKFSKWLLLIWFLVGTQSVLYSLSFQLTGVGFNESIPFHFKSGMKGAGIGDFYQLIVEILLTIILLIVCALFYFKTRIKSNGNHLWQVGILIPVLFFNPLNYDIYETYGEVEENPSFLFKNLYKVPPVDLKSDKKYNVVWVYAEAFERIYLNQEIFPDLAPNLAQIERESVSFSNVHQVWGTGWTIAGIVASQCGVPLYAVGRGNNNLNQLPSFLPKIKGIGNILKDDGYQCVFIQGSAKEFAGNDKFLETHGFQMYAFENIDKTYKKKQNISRWGLNDDQTLNFALAKYQSLQKENQPFALMVSTINTHSPRGVVPIAFKGKKYKDGKNMTLNAFHVGDMLISQFIREIREKDIEKNTIIVVSSDHLTTRNMVSPILEKYPEYRRNLFMINFPENINPKIISKVGSTMDEGVTLLEMIGYPMDKLGLGVSLLSKEKTLTERSYPNTDEVLKSWKKYYFQFWE